jgi:hypothetical protein
MLAAFAIYMTADLILSILVLLLAYKRRHAIRAVIRTWLDIPLPCTCDMMREMDEEEVEFSTNDKDEGEDELF